MISVEDPLAPTRALPPSHSQSLGTKSAVTASIARMDPTQRDLEPIEASRTNKPVFGMEQDGKFN